MKAEDLLGPIDRLKNLLKNPHPDLMTWMVFLQQSVKEVLPMLAQVRYGSQQLHITGTHFATFRSGEVARVIGASMITPEGCEPRPCLEVLFEDGKTDFVPISDLSNY